MNRIVSTASTLAAFFDIRTLHSRVSKIVERISFGEPGASVRVLAPSDDDGGNVYVNVCRQAKADASSADSYYVYAPSISFTFCIGHTSQISRDKQLEEIVVKAVQEAFYVQAKHEVDEWLKIDGVHVKDPHPEQRKETA